MTYLINDIYTASGSAKLFGCWTPNVTKHVSESFYSWEQDNLPLYDLEERTALLWEQVGFPASSAPPMVLLVSADFAGESCSSNVFTDFSSLVASLPKIINAPIIIEVASFGDLGELNLEGISFGASGSLEIINRLFYNSKNSSLAQLKVAGHLTTGPHGSYENIINQVSAGSTDGNLRPYYLNTTIYSPYTLLTNEKIFSSVASLDARVNSNLTPVMSYYPYKNQVTSMDFTRLSVGFKTGSVDISTDVVISSTPFESGATTEVSLYDPSSYDQSTDEELYKAGIVGSPATVLLYHNYLQSVRIKDCGGPIYLRGFIIEGEGSRSLGLDITNSDVYLEDITVDRFIDKGIRVLNSNVRCYKNLVVNRCYGIQSGVRTSKAWTTNIQSIDLPDDLTCGLELVNSRLFINNQQERYLNLLGGSLATNTWYSPYNCLITLTRNSTGIRAINSFIYTEDGRSGANSNALANISSLSVMVFEGNANVGLELKNSTLHLECRTEFINNTRGLLADNSQIDLEEFNFLNNHIYGIKLNNTNFLYGIKELESTSRWDLADLSYYDNFTGSDFIRFSFGFINNGQHLISNNSLLSIKDSKSTQNKYGRLYAYGSHAVDSNNNKLPGFDIKNNSKIKLIHPTIETSGVEDSYAKGIALSIENNSEATLLGTERCITSMFLNEASWTYEKAKSVAGIYASNGSTIKLRGPTLISTFGVDILAENNSNILIEPHKDDSGALAITHFDLSSSKNHTMVELQSVRACIVVDKSSNLIMEDLGDYNICWRSSANGQQILSALAYDTSTTGYNTAQYTSAGYVQFYPNPNDAADYGIGGVASNLDMVPVEATINGTSYHYLLKDYRTPDVYSLSTVTNGGMCVRALNNSNVLVKNVNFPCGWWNPSSVIYDTSAADGVCSRLFIWNFANGSTLRSSYTSVSSLYPYDAGYHGPAAYWFSGAGVIASGMPTTTEDTGSRSVLDQFGTSGNSMYGQSTPENMGPFRLYLSVDSVANILKHSGSNPGVAYQVWSQGYQVSSNLQPLTADLSAIYGKVLRYSGGSVAASGYYYADEMVAVNPTQIMLDEPSSNLFANAKNGATGSSRKPQICVIYNPTTDYDGESRKNNSLFFGRGFKSSNIFDIMDES